MKKNICFFLLSIMIYSCNNLEREVQSILNQASNLIESAPDSALLLLEEIRHPQYLKKNQLAEYELLTIQAKDKAYRDISTDTLIFEIRDYFKEKEDLGKAALANFYCGRVFQSQKKFDPAMKAYLEVESLTKITEDNYLRGLSLYFMGDLYYQKTLNQEALDKFREAIQYFSLLPDKYNNILVSYRMLGNIFAMEEQFDSAFSYYNKALTLALLHNSVSQQAYMKQCLGYTFHQIGDFEKAKENLNEALQLDTNKNELPRIYLNIARIYHDQGLPDSATFYSNKSLQMLDEIKNPRVLTNTYLLLSKMEEENGHYLKALEYHQYYSENLASILDEEENQNLQEIQKKYKFEVMENTNNRLLLEKQRIWLLCIGLILCIVVGIFLFYREKMKNRYARLEAEEKFQQLSILKESISTKEQIYQDLFVHQFKVLKNTALLDEYLENEEREKGQKLLKKFREIVYGENGFDWDLLYTAMNVINSGELDLIHKGFPQLSSDEFKVCCLTYAGFTNLEMSVILDLSSSTIQSRKTDVREKIGVDKGRNFKEYLSKKLEEMY